MTNTKLSQELNYLLGLIKDKEVRFKVTISIILGLAGFGLNFFPINFYFEFHKASYLFGLVFPMVVALAWGWKYGLLSATLGMGCQTMWFLWLGSSGYGPFVSVPLFTLWVVWHGWYSDQRRKKEVLNKEIRWFNPYLVEIPFRAFNTIILYTVFRLIFLLNPAPWAPDLPSQIVPLSFVNFVVLKEIINGFITVLIADVILNLEIIRKMLKLERKELQKNTNYIISFSILLGILLYISETFIVYSLEYKDQISLLDFLVLDVPTAHLLVRLITLLTCMGGGLLISIFIRKQRESEEAERKALSQIDKNIDQFSILVDQIRNPLQIILSSLELETENLKDTIITQLKTIEEIIIQLDERTLESKKLKDFLRKEMG